MTGWSALSASGLLRAAEAAGGNGAVLARGDPDAGALLVVLTCRGSNPIILERRSQLTGDFTWNKPVISRESASEETVARLIDKKKRFDRDLWVLELDIPNVEQFIEDSLA